MEVRIVRAQQRRCWDPRVFLDVVVSFTHHWSQDALTVGVSFVPSQSKLDMRRNCVLTCGRWRSLVRPKRLFVTSAH